MSLGKEKHMQLTDVDNIDWKRMVFGSSCAPGNRSAMFKPAPEGSSSRVLYMKHSVVRRQSYNNLSLRNKVLAKRKLNKPNPQ